MWYELFKLAPWLFPWPLCENNRRMPCPSRPSISLQGGSSDTNMQFRQLRYFTKVLEAGSFSRAAATIHVAQPALSQQVAELEERLGVILLVRSARGVRPTAAGEVLYREACEILHQLDQL